MKLSDFLVEQIYSKTKTDKIFGYIGGMIAHIVDSIYLNEDVEMVNMITEQGVGFAAEGYARSTKKLGVAIATSGPGATNLVTPIANCFFDSTPVLFITGQVNTFEYKKYNIKQCGFQETNIVDIVKPITKYAKTVTNPKDILYELEKAIDIATSGRKGPVLLDIPMDIQRAELDISKLKKYKPKQIKNNIKFDFSIFEQAKKPLILIGNGINLSDCSKELNSLLQKLNIPIVQSLMGASCVNSDYKYNMGMIGTYGNRYGNIALYDSDLLIVIGSRMDIRQTGGKVDFLQTKKIIHVDIDDNELNCTKFKKVKIKSDAKEFIKYLSEKDIKLDICEWQNKCIMLKEKYSNEKKQYSMPNKILSQIYRALDNNTVITADVGQNQMWAAQSFEVNKNFRFLTSGGHGCMGFALPAGIGAAITGESVLIISGDGGFQMNIQELEIIKRRKLPVKIIVMNNQNLGMVRTFQELYFEKRYASTVYDYSAPDFSKIASAYGIKSIGINAAEFNIDLIKDNINSNEAVLFNIIFDDIKTQVEPRVQFGNSIENAHPLLNKCELEELLK